MKETTCKIGDGSSSHYPIGPGSDSKTSED